MKTSLDCIPCFVRQALEASRFVTDDTNLHASMLRNVLQSAASLDLDQSPPMTAQKIHRKLRELSGVADPYRDVKQRFNRMAMEMLPDLRKQVEQADNSIALALRLAIAGNIIDLGVDGGITESQAKTALANTLSEPFHGEIDEFLVKIDSADRILYLADNAGEIAFDRLLIEQLPAEKITLAVRGNPIINDVTREDAIFVGMDQLVNVIDNGSDAPGTVLGDCSQEFRQQFESADLIIAKGQGNYETLSDEPANIMFLFKVKCPVIGKQVNLETGTHVLLPQVAANTGGVVRE